MRKLLLISPIFYLYEKEIIEQAKKKGYDTTFISLYPKNFLIFIFIKMLSKVNKKFELFLYEIYFKLSFKSKLKKNKFNKILVINGETLTKNILKLLKEKYLIKNNEIILYIWTPIDRYKNILNIYKLFSKTLSFEKKDCEKYGFKFLPNFYSNMTLKFKKNLNERYDLYFVGQYRKERFFLKKELEKIKDRDLKIVLYHNFFTFLIFKIIKYKEYKCLKIKDFVYRQVNREEMYKNMSEAKCLLDDTDIKQEGLTQRVFDALVLEKKLITTNNDIKNYNFYNKNNIFIIDRESPKIPKEFFNNKYSSLDEDIVSEYSLEKWLEILIGD